MEVDLDRLVHNIEEVRRVIGPGKKLIAVAKGDAYGHGLLEVVPTMVDAGADVIAVGNLNQAVRLRNSGCRAKILLFGSCLPQDVAETVVEYEIIPTLWDEAGARVYSKAARGPLEVYLKVDTGLNRLGVLPGEAAKVAKAIEDLPNLYIGCIYTHFGDTTKDEDFLVEQFSRFDAAIKTIRAAGVEASFIAAASSPVVSTHPEMLLTGVDPGRLLYGFYHPPDPPVSLDLMPVARAVKSRFIQTKWVEVGHRIGGYGGFYAPRRTLVGVLPFGWVDGLFLSAGSRASVLVRSRRCPMIEIHLEHCLIDLTEVDGAEAGDEAVLFGEQGGAVITLGEHASWAGVSELEVVMQLGRTIPHVYFKEGWPVSVGEVGTE